MAGSMALGLSLTGPFKVLKSIKSHSKAPSERIWNQHLSSKGERENYPERDLRINKPVDMKVQFQNTSACQNTFVAFLP